MKMILAIVTNDDSSKVSNALTNEGFSVTRLATTGGFLMSGNTTLLIGVQNEQVEQAIELISGSCKKRSRMTPSAAAYGAGMSVFPVEISVGGATIFVLDVERFEKV